MPCYIGLGSTCKRVIRKISGLITEQIRHKYTPISLIVKLSAFIVDFYFAPLGLGLLHFSISYILGGPTSFVFKQIKFDCISKMQFGEL